MKSAITGSYSLFLSRIRPKILCTAVNLPKGTGENDTFRRIPVLPAGREQDIPASLQGITPAGAPAPDCFPGMQGNREPVPAGAGI
jgi:hypothetical protein